MISSMSRSQKTRAPLVKYRKEVHNQTWAFSSLHSSYVYFQMCVSRFVYNVHISSMYAYIQMCASRCIHGQVFIPQEEAYVSGILPSVFMPRFVYNMCIGSRYTYFQMCMCIYFVNVYTNVYRKGFSQIPTATRPLLTSLTLLRHSRVRWLDMLPLTFNTLWCKMYGV